MPNPRLCVSVAASAWQQRRHSTALAYVHCANMKSSIKLEICNISLRHKKEGQATAIGNMYKKPGEDRTCNSEDMFMDTDKHTDTRSSELSEVE